jgi:hypothetical protein
MVAVFELLTINSSLLMKIYLDVCCLNRPFDDQMQDRVRLAS